MSQLNPPCTGDETTCGHQFNRSASCYQVPDGFTAFAPGWTTASGVLATSMSNCPDVATTPAYDASSGAKVARGTDGKLVLTTLCNPCNYVTAVTDWAMNPCPCVKTAADYCNYTQGVGPGGVCQSDGTTYCNTTMCPKPTTSLSSRAQVASKGASKGQQAAKVAAVKAEKKAAQENKALAKKARALEKEASKQHVRAQKQVKRTQLLKRQAAAAAARAAANCTSANCKKECYPNDGICADNKCRCLSAYPPSYALPSFLQTSDY